MNHYASPEFWASYRTLPAEVQSLADKSFALLKSDLRHPSLRLKRVGEFYSVRVGLHYRALGISIENGTSWFWVGTHAEYDKLVGQPADRADAPASGFSPLHVAAARLSPRTLALGPA